MRRGSQRHAGGIETYILDGGIDAWKKAGLPVTLDRNAADTDHAAGADRRRQPCVAGAMLGASVVARLLHRPAFVGAGLVFAGVTGFCGMARILDLDALEPAHRLA